MDNSFCLFSTTTGWRCFSWRPIRLLLSCSWHEAKHPSETPCHKDAACAGVYMQDAVLLPPVPLSARSHQGVPSSHDFLAVFSLSLLYRFIFEDVSGLTTHVSELRKRNITDANKPWSPPSQTLSLPLDRFSLGSAQGIRRHPPVCLARGSPAEWRKAAFCRASIAKETPKDQVRRNAKLLPNICYPRSKHRHPRLIIVASRRPLGTIYPAFARRETAQKAHRELRLPCSGGAHTAAKDSPLLQRPCRLSFCSSRNSTLRKGASSTFSCCHVSPCSIHFL